MRKLLYHTRVTALPTLKCRAEAEIEMHDVDVWKSEYSYIFDHFTNHPRAPVWFQSTCVHHLFGLLCFRAALEGEPQCFLVFFLFCFCSQIKSSMAVISLGHIEWLTWALSVCSLWDPLLSPLCLWHQQCALVLLLEALCARLPAALRSVDVCMWRACGHFARHTHSDHFEPTLLQFLALSSETVDRLWLGQTETGWRIGGSWSVVYRVTQQRDGGLSLNVLHKDMRREKRWLYTQYKWPSSWVEKF